MDDRKDKSTDEEVVDLLEGSVAARQRQWRQNLWRRLRRKQAREVFEEDADESPSEHHSRGAS
jgi:hypothetical protein